MEQPFLCNYPQPMPLTAFDLLDGFCFSMLRHSGRLSVKNKTKRNQIEINKVQKYIILSILNEQQLMIVLICPNSDTKHAESQILWSTDRIFLVLSMTAGKTNLNHAWSRNCNVTIICVSDKVKERIKNYSVAFSIIIDFENLVSFGQWIFKYDNTSLSTSIPCPRTRNKVIKLWNAYQKISQKKHLQHSSRGW